jgi:hypothetical protein
MVKLISTYLPFVSLNPHLTAAQAMVMMSHIIADVPRRARLCFTADAQIS